VLALGLMSWRILDFLDALIAHARQPALEGLSLGAGDGLDQTEEALCVRAIQFPEPAHSLDGKGCGNLPPSLGKL